LDLGSNRGTFCALIKVARSDIDVWACEINPIFVAESKKRYPWLHVIDKVLSEDTVTKQFDFIHCSDVIEHIWDLDGLMRAIKNNLKPQGYVLIRTPNGDCIDSKINGRNWWSYIVPHHVQIFSYLSLEKLFVRHGFVNVTYGFDQQELWALFKKSI